MSTFRFRHFKVYQDAKIFRSHVLDIVQKLREQRAFDLADQIQRASLSVLLNIAEGSAKKSDAEFARFLEISISSTNEVMAGIEIAHDEGKLSVDEMALMEKESEEICKQLGGFIKKLRKYTVND